MNNYCSVKVERTIESVLSMSGGETSATSEEVKPSSNLQPMSIGMFICLYAKRPTLLGLFIILLSVIGTIF